MFSRVDYVIQQQSTNANDLEINASQEVTFAPNTSQVFLAVEIVDDSMDEENETFFIDIQNPENGSFGTQTRIQVTIQDNDESPTLTVNEVFLPKMTLCICSSRIGHPKSTPRRI